MKDVVSSCQSPLTAAFFVKKAITPKIMAITPKMVSFYCF